MVFRDKFEVNAYINPRKPRPEKGRDITHKNSQKESTIPTPGNIFIPKSHFARLFNKETGHTFPSSVVIHESIVNLAKKSRPFACDQIRNMNKSSLNRLSYHKLKP